MRHAFEKSPSEFVTALAAVATFFVALMTVFLLSNELKGLSETLESQSYNYITEGLSEYDKLLVDYADVMPYVEGDANGLEMALPGGDPEAIAEIYAVANYKLDFIDSFYSQESHINWPEYTRCGWETYFRDSFQRSQALCTLMCRSPLQYGDSVQALGLRVCAGRPSARETGCATITQRVELPPLSSGTVACFPDLEKVPKEAPPIRRA